MKINPNIQLASQDACTGCAACASVCPKGCITILEDNEGFLQPKIDMEACIDCHKCEKTCPIISPIAIHEDFETQTYAAINKDEEVRQRSSSGGMFYALAKLTIEQGGVVFGARFNEQWEVEQDYTETIEGIDPFMRSKYVQSRVGTTYQKAKDFLKQGRIVLYVGTPCIIAGLREYLGEDYEKLLAVDLVCHGVPSPRVWRKYVEEEIGIEKLHNFSFRNKQNGWVDFQCAITTKGDTGLDTRYESMQVNTYLRGFLDNVFLRRCCYHCNFKNIKSIADISLADSWGIQYYRPDMYDNKGTSLMIIHSERGRKMASALTGIRSVDVSIEDAVIYNDRVVKSVPLTRYRKYFFFFNRFMAFRRAMRITYFFVKYINKVEKKGRKIIHKLHHT